ncbi:MAG: hypothetical protein U0T83_07765 [Bacteriovoracaceae bacterium]
MITEYNNEINVGIFEVVLRRINNKNNKECTNEDFSISSNVFYSSNCAMMVNARQQIQVNGGLEGKVVKLKTPDGTFEVDNGSTSFANRLVRALTYLLL